MKFTVCFVSFVLFAVFLENGESARILGFFPTWSRSHLIIHMATIQTLVDKGHDVTVVTALSLNVKNPKYRHVKIAEPVIPRDIFKKSIDSQKSGWEMFKDTSKLLAFGMKMANDSVNDSAVKKLMQEESFDVVVLGIFLNDFHMGIAAHFKCPIILIDTHKATTLINGFIGNPSEPLYVPSAISSRSQPFSFVDRLHNVFINIIETVIFRLYLNREMNALYKINFPSNKYPELDEVKKNVSLILHVSHFSQGPVRPNVPAYVEIGGIQIKPKPDPLPKDIEQMLNGAREHGAIYFCLGSNARSSELKPETMTIVYKVLSSLKQKVIWKWEDDNLPGNSSNIIFKKWLPQDDILAHPNVRLFISHAGLGSIVESEYHGVPIVGMPLFGDQFQVMSGVVDSGFGLSVNYHELTEESFRAIVMEVLENPKYKDSVQHFSKLYRDRPMSARDTAAFWIEYIIRHKGAKHMQSPAVHMNTIQYYGLDVMGFLIGAIYIVYKVFAIVIKKLVCKLFKGKCNESKNKKSKSE